MRKKRIDLIKNLLTKSAYPFLGNLSRNLQSRLNYDFVDAYKTSIVTNYPIRVYLGAKILGPVFYNSFSTSAPNDWLTPSSAAIIVGLGAAIYTSAENSMRFKDNLYNGRAYACPSLFGGLISLPIEFFINTYDEIKWKRYKKKSMEMESE